MKTKKKIRSCFFKSLLPAGVFFFFLMTDFGISLAFAEKTFHYKTYNPQTGEVFNHFSYTLNKIPSGVHEVHWVIREGESVTEEHYLLDKDFQTIHWRVINVQNKTDYEGKKQGQSLVLNGQFNGIKVKKVI